MHEDNDDDIDMRSIVWEYKYDDYIDMSSIVWE